MVPVGNDRWVPGAIENARVRVVGVRLEGSVVGGASESVVRGHQSALSWRRLSVTQSLSSGSGEHQYHARSLQQWAISIAAQYLGRNVAYGSSMRMMTRWLRARLDAVRARDLRLVAGLFALGVLALVFLKLGNEISEGETDRIDRALLLVFRNSPSDPIGSAAVEASVMHISALGSTAVTALIVIIATLFFALAGRWRYAVLMIACATGTVIGMTLLKGLYSRPRPTVVTPLELPEGLSFPSGHSMISAALYLTLGVLIARALPTRRLRVFAVATGAFLTMIIGVSRVYLGVHYPTDVLAGWTAGAAWALICGLVVQLLGERGVTHVPVPKPEP